MKQGFATVYRRPGAYNTNKSIAAVILADARIVISLQSQWQSSCGEMAADSERFLNISMGFVNGTTDSDRYYKADKAHI